MGMPIVKKTHCPHTRWVSRAAPALDEEPTEQLPIVHVLVEEDFFWEKVDSTLRALAKEPFTPDWQGDVLGQLHAADATAAVVDLENEAIQALEVVRMLRESGEGGLPVLAYASYDREDLLREAEELGAMTVARSTFASSLVRLLQELTAADDEDAAPAGDDEAAS